MHTPSNILLIDDDEDDSIIFAKVLSEIDPLCSFATVHDANGLLESLDKSLPDIIFLDLVMPTLDGYYCLKQIRKNLKYRSLPVIVYSDLNDRLNTNMSYELGANFFVVKPVSLAELASVLQHILNMDRNTLSGFCSISDFVLNHHINK